MGDRPALTIERLESSDGIVFRFRGRVDEGADFSAVSLLDQRPVAFDLGGVELFNSVGISKWLQFIARLPADRQVEIYHCPSFVADQANMISTFFGNGKLIVKSLFAPYFCAECDSSLLVHLLVPKDFLGGDLSKAPVRACPKCSKTMTFDDLEDDFFAFLGAE